MIQKITNKMKSFGKAVCSSQRLKTMALMLAIGTTATLLRTQPETIPLVQLPCLK